MSAVPPLPPVTRLVDAPPRSHTHPHDQPHTIPGWVAAVIYLVALIGFAVAVAPVVF